MASWYWHKEGDKDPRGPIDLSELKQMADQGVLQPSDKVWRDGMDDWQEASEIPELFDSTPSGHRQAPASAGAGEDRASGTTGPRGVGGWLLLFCIILTILAPIGTLIGIVQTFVAIEEVMNEYRVIEDAFLIETIVQIGIVIYGFVVGVIIWSGHKKGRKRANQYLTVRLGLHIVVQFVILIMVVVESSDAFSAMLGGTARALLGELLFFGIWFAYFKKSKRVANTYGEPAS